MSSAVPKPDLDLLIASTRVVRGTGVKLRISTKM